jgi:hypothetical protein
MFLKKALFTAGLAAAATDSVTFGITLDGHTPLCLKYQPPNEAFDFDDSVLVPLLYEDRSSLSLFANIQMDEDEENLSVNQVLFYSPSGHVFDLSLEDLKIPEGGAKRKDGKLDFDGLIADINTTRNLYIFKTETGLVTRVQHFGEDGYHVQIALDKLDDKVRGLFGNFHAGTTYKVKAEPKNGKKHKNGEFATVTINNEDSSEDFSAVYDDNKACWMIEDTHSDILLPASEANLML